MDIDNLTEQDIFAILILRQCLSEKCIEIRIKATGLAIFGCFNIHFYATFFKRFKKAYQNLLEDTEQHFKNFQVNIC